MNTNNYQPITAALPELAVIGNLVYENYDASHLVDAIVREDLREEHFSDAACRAANAMMRLGRRMSAIATGSWGAIRA